MNKRKSGISGRLKSFVFAFDGIIELIKSEPNSQIHLLASLIAVVLGLLLKITLSEWCIIIFAISLVWISEAFNTAIEKLVDHLFPEINETARCIKDISAGAVLIISIAAFIAGIIIFVPKLF